MNGRTANKPTIQLRAHHEAAKAWIEAHPQRVSACFIFGASTFLVSGFVAPRLQLNPDSVRTSAFPNTGAVFVPAALGVIAAGLLAVAFVVRDRLQRDDDPAGRGMLLPRAYQPFVWLVGLPALLGLIVLSTRVAHMHGPLAVDRAIDGRLAYRFRNFQGFFLDITELGSPLGVAVLSCALGFLLLAMTRNWRAALLVAAGPAAAGAFSEYLLKPLIGRPKDDLYSFPSGHTTGAVSLAIVLGILLLPHGALSRVPRSARAVLACLMLLLASAVPIGVIVLNWHYATDVVGGFAVAALCITALVMAIDALWGRSSLSSRDAGRFEPPNHVKTPNPASVDRHQPV